MIHNDIEKFVDLKPASYSFLKSCCLARTITNKACTDYDLKLILGAPTNDGAMRFLELRCTGVRHLKIGQLEGMMGLFIEIQDIRDRQLEDLSFRVSEQENDAFSFFCTDFYVEFNS